MWCDNSGVIHVLYSVHYAHSRGVASGTASRTLALLDFFWLAGPIKPTFQRVFLAPLLDYWLAGARVFLAPALIVDVVKELLRMRHSGPSRFYRLAAPLHI